LYYVVSNKRYEYSGTVTRSKVIAGGTSSDYWKIEGNKATRVHLEARVWTFTPAIGATYPGNGKVNDPWLFRLQESRVTKVRIISTPDREHSITDDWRHSTTSSELSEK